MKTAEAILNEVWGCKPEYQKRMIEMNPSVGKIKQAMREAAEQALDRAAEEVAKNWNSNTQLKLEAIEKLKSELK